MKKIITLGIMVILSVLVTGCTSVEKREMETEVIACEIGEYHPDEEDLRLSKVYLAQGNVAMYSTYKLSAERNGSYYYNITINIDGIDYIVERETEYEVGAYIIVEKVDTYENNQYIKTEYK